MQALKLSKIEGFEMASNHYPYQIAHILSCVLLFFLIVQPQHVICSEQDDRARAIRRVSPNFTESPSYPMPDSVDPGTDPGFEFVLQNGHAHEINDIAVDPTGNYIVSHDMSGAIKIWDLKTGRVLRNFMHHKIYRHTNLLAMDHEGRFIITGAQDGTVNLWSFWENKLLKVFDNNAPPITGVAMDQTGLVFASNSNDGITIWDIDKDTPVKEYSGLYGRGYQQLAMDPKGRYCILTSNRFFYRYDVQTGTIEEKFTSNSGEITDIKVSPDGDLLAMGCRYGHVEIRNPHTSKLIRTLEAHTRKKARTLSPSLVNSVCFDPSATLLVSGGRDGSIKIWRVQDGTLIRTIKDAHIGVTSLAIDPSGELLVSGGSNGDMKIWDLNTGEHVRTLLPLSHHEGLVDSIRKYDTDLSLKFLVTQTGDNVASVWDLQSLELIRNFKLFNPSFTFELDLKGRYLVTSHRSNRLKKWDLRSGELLKTLQYNRKGYSINGFKIDPGGKYIISTHDHVSRPYSGIDPVANIWSVETGKLINTIHKVNKFKIDPKGRYVACVKESNEIGIWELKSGELLHTFQRENTKAPQLRPLPQGVRYSGGDKPKPRGVFKMIMEPNSGFLLAVYHNGEMDILDIKNRKLVKTVQISPYRLYSVEAQHIKFDSSGDYICYTGHNHQGARIWQTHTGKLVCRMKDHGGPLGSVIIDPKRRSAVSVGRDIRLWDLATGKIIKTVKGKIRGDQCGLDSDGLRLAGKAGDKIEIWNLQTGEREREFDKKGHIYNFDVGEKGVLSKKTVVLTEDPKGNTYLWDPFSGDKIEGFEFAHEQIEHEWLKFKVRGEYLINVDQRIQMSIRNLNTNSGVTMVNVGPEWIAYTRDGYFDSSRHGGSLVAMAKDLKAYGMDQFAVRNNRPDIILAKMALGGEKLLTHFYNQYQKRLKKMKIFEEELSFDLHVPTVDILRSEQDGKFVTLECVFDDSSYPLRSYNIYVNDVPLFGGLGKKLANSHVLKTLRVELTSGRNKIEVACINAKGVESYRALRYIDYDKKTIGDLYYVGFGVSKYKDPALDLKYADKDAKDLAELFLEMKDAFSKVHIKTFVNQQVSIRNMKVARKFLNDAKVDDTLVLFVAGHGLHDIGEKSTYYYLTHHAELDNLDSTALSYDAFEEFLTWVAPREKLFLIDACESGEVEESKQDIYFTMADTRGFKPRTTRAIIRSQRGRKDAGKAYRFGFDRYIYNDLIRRSGAMVFSSSKGNEFSYESDSLENGFFTEGIIRAMRAQAADKDSNQYLSVEELREYVISEVSEISNNMQHPTVDRDNIHQRIEFPSIPPD